jgi:hypothetical protein
MTTPALASPSVLQAIWWQQFERMNMTEAEREKAKSNVAAVAVIQDTFDAACSTINQNGDLSAQGRANALMAASKRALDALDALAKPNLAALDAQIVSASRALRRAAAGPDATAVTEIRAVETRALFAQVDPLLQPVTYLELCANGEDDAACVAVENASAFAPLLAADTIEKGRALRGARSLPDQAHELEVAQDLRALLAAAVATTRKHVTLSPLVDPLQIAPLGPTATDPDEE